MKKLRLYVDTSVIGGCFDDEFTIPSNSLIQAAANNMVVLLISDVVLRELEKAPQKVRDIITSLPHSSIERLSSTSECLLLRDAYRDAKILSPKWLDDLTHVAIATVYRADAIVSWNFKHIVRLDKMKAYNHVNFLNGYGLISIVSPMEVVIDNDD